MSPNCLLARVGVPAQAAPAEQGSAVRVWLLAVLCYLCKASQAPADVPSTLHCMLSDVRQIRWSGVSLHVPTEASACILTAHADSSSQTDCIDATLRTATSLGTTTPQHMSII